jgi:hypothetical protein
VLGSPGPARTPAALTLTGAMTFGSETNGVYPAPRAGQAAFFTVTSMGMPMTSIANLISSFVTTPL